MYKKEAPAKEGRRSVPAGAIQSPGAGRLKTRLMLDARNRLEPLRTGNLTHRSSFGSQAPRRAEALVGPEARSELEPDLQLQVAHVLRARGRAEARVVRLQPGRIDRAVRQELGVADRQVGRAVVLICVWRALIDDRVERVERVQAELELAAAAQPDVARDREVGPVVSAQPIMTLRPDSRPTLL